MCLVGVILNFKHNLLNIAFTNITLLVNHNLVVRMFVIKLTNNQKSQYVCHALLRLRERCSKAQYSLFTISHSILKQTLSTIYVFCRQRM